MVREWRLARRSLSYGGRTLVMGVLNVTPDSFSDGGRFLDAGRAAERAAQMVEEGADIIDVGGESTRPGGAPITAREELARVLPVLEALAGRIGVPLSVDTTKREVARAALAAGAEIVNDISGLRFDAALADETASANAGLVLMHSRGKAATLHAQPPVTEIMTEVVGNLRRAVEEAERRGVARAALALDPGFGFGKSFEQNLELLARLDRLAAEFTDFPLLVGTSRKSFIGRILGGAPPEERLHGTNATIAVAILHGAHLVRVHDVRSAVETARVVDAIKEAASEKVFGDGR
jgi:dihydropteroate synthase